MWSYLGRRILATIPVVLIVAVLVFLMLSGEGRKPAAKEAVWSDGDALAAPGIAGGGGR